MTDILSIPYQTRVYAYLFSFEGALATNTGA